MEREIVGYACGYDEEEMVVGDYETEYEAAMELTSDLNGEECILTAPVYAVDIIKIIPDCDYFLEHMAENIADDYGDWCYGAFMDSVDFAKLNSSYAAMMLKWMQDNSLYLDVKDIGPIKEWEVVYDNDFKFSRILET